VLDDAVREAAGRTPVFSFGEVRRHLRAADALLGKDRAADGNVFENRGAGPLVARRGEGRDQFDRRARDHRRDFAPAADAAMRSDLLDVDAIFGVKRPARVDRSMALDHLGQPSHGPAPQASGANDGLLDSIFKPEKKKP
jgi:hypothetical protein